MVCVSHCRLLLSDGCPETEMRGITPKPGCLGCNPEDRVCTGIPEGFRVNVEGLNKYGTGFGGVVLPCWPSMHPVCYSSLQTSGRGGRGPLQRCPLLLTISPLVLHPTQSHSTYLDVGHCGSSQDASREGLSLSSHSSRRSSHTALSDSACRCQHVRGQPSAGARRGWRAEQPPKFQGSAGSD